MKEHQFIVTIRCNLCGEKYALKGKMKKGRVDTGFKRCLCNNENDFQIKTNRI